MVYMRNRTSAWFSDFRMHHKANKTAELVSEGEIVRISTDLE